MAAAPLNVIENNSYFKTLREKATAGADGALPLTDADVDIWVFDATNVSQLVVWWTATTPAATATLELWVRDGYPSDASPTWLKLDEVATLAPGTPGVLNVHRAAMCYIRIQGSPTGTNMVVRAYGTDNYVV